MIENHWSLFEADVRRIYGENAATLSAREAYVRLAGLPDDAASLGYDGWTLQHELLATTVEMLDFTRRSLMAVWVDEKGRRELKRVPSLEIPRPESVRPKKKSSWVDFAKGLARKVGG